MWMVCAFALPPALLTRCAHTLQCVAVFVVSWRGGGGKGTNSRLALLRLSTAAWRCGRSSVCPVPHAPVRTRAEPLGKHLESMDLKFMQFAFRWMNCLLLRELPLHIVLRLWDTCLSEPQGFDDFHVYVCTAMLLRFSKTLRELDSLVSTVRCPAPCSLRARRAASLNGGGRIPDGKAACRPLFSPAVVVLACGCWLWNLGLRVALALLCVFPPADCCAAFPLALRLWYVCVPGGCGGVPAKVAHNRVGNQGH